MVQKTSLWYTGTGSQVKALELLAKARGMLAERVDVSISVQKTSIGIR
jgi:hypothetical protein